MEMDGKKTRLLKSNVSRAPDNRPHDFTFDHSYWSVDRQDENFVGQATVFEDLGKPVVDCAFEGYNACVFAYGKLFHRLTKRAITKTNSYLHSRSNRVRKNLHNDGNSSGFRNGRTGSANL